MQASDYDVLKLRAFVSKQLPGLCARVRSQINRDGESEDDQDRTFRTHFRPRAFDLLIRDVRGQFGDLAEFGPNGNGRGEVVNMLDRYIEQLGLHLTPREHTAAAD